MFVAACVTVFVVAVLVTFNQLFRFIILALVVSMVFRPIVDFIDARFGRIPRWLTTLIVYLLLLSGMIAIPVSTLPSIVAQVAQFISELPTMLELSIVGVTEFLTEPVTILGGRYTIPVDQITVNEFQQYLGQLVSLIAGSLSSVNSLILNITSVTVSFISSTVFVLFLSYYLTKDGHVLADKIIHFVPDGYHDDAHNLMERSNLIWGAFLRGQLILMLTMGIVTFVVASILGLPNPVVLGVIAGAMEIIPYAGPVLAAIPAAMLAWFQHDVSWLGMLVNPFWFTIITLGCYWLVQQLENYVLVPRILGHQLKLHPAFVFVAALAGWQLAGVFGIFLASPMLATLRLFGTFVYGKLTDQTISDLQPLIEEDTEANSAESSTPEQPDQAADGLKPAVLRTNSSSTTREISPRKLL